MDIVDKIIELHINCLKVSYYNKIVSKNQN